MEDEDAELRNPFPSPPHHYTKYTSHNLHLLSALRERAGEEADLSSVDQGELLADQEDVPEWSLKKLEKPRVDWILEEGQYTVFGDTWFVKESIPSLAELGGHQLYPADPSADRRPALKTILRSILVTYSRLLNAGLLPPSTALSSTPPEWQKQMEWITIMAQNIMAAANDLRPVQARASLEAMMRRQLELRREETKTIHAKCDALEAKLSEMRATVQSLKEEAPVPEQLRFSNGEASIVNIDDVVRWAEEVG